MRAAEVSQNSRLLTSRLPNGLEVRHVSNSDLRFIYDEIFLQQSYMQHGIILRKGATVLDIGGNIGLFSMWAASEAGPQGHIVALEPLPALHSAMTYNVASHKKWCGDRGTHPAPITVLQKGAGDGSCSEADFTLYSSASGWSTMEPDADETQANMRVFLRAALAERHKDGGLGGGLLPTLGALLFCVVPSWLFDIISRWYVGRMLAARTVVACPLTTVSHVIQLHNLRQIDLLKVDVERAELAVLAGIDAADWGRIHQAVLEVHDTPPGRLREVVDLLEGPADFRPVITQQAATLEGSTLWNVWARRGFATGE